MYRNYYGAKDLLKCQVDLADKQDGMDFYLQYFLARTQKMFKWNGLPETIPQRDLELLIQCLGYCTIAEHKGDLYALRCTLGGEYNAYYRPKYSIVANPYLNMSGTLEIGKKCILVPNDSLFVGLKPLISRYASLIVENELTMLVADVNSRTPAIVTATNEDSRKSAEKYLNEIKMGLTGIVYNPKGMIDLEGINSVPFASQANNELTNLIEYHQYLKGGLFNDLGMNQSFNMKREALNSAETEQGSDTLLTLVDDMLWERQNACEEINKLFGTNISVELDSIWKTHQLEKESAEELLQNGGEENEDTEMGKTDSSTDDQSSDKTD